MAKAELKLKDTRRKIFCNCCGKPLEMGLHYIRLVSGKDNKNPRANMCAYCIVSEAIGHFGIKYVSRGKYE